MNEKAIPQSGSAQARKACPSEEAWALCVVAHQSDHASSEQTQLLTRRVCKVCGTEQPLTAFHPSGKYSWRWQCRECEKQRNYVWRKANPERWKTLQLRLAKKCSMNLKAVNWSSILLTVRGETACL